MIRFFKLFVLLAITAIEVPNYTHASAPDTINPMMFQDLNWRCIGPFRGGRSTTVCGVRQQPYTYYFGSVGGGVWKTVDGGHSWKNITDGYLQTGSVGAVAVAPSDPNVIYIGMGEAPVRGVMTSSGDGVYKSSDGGKTWVHMGLEKTMHISQVRVHPDNPDIVWVAAQGSPYAPTEDRGIYKSTDGGLSWSKVHFIDENSGACDLSLDVQNPRVLYAAFWDHTRLPWYMRSGGEGSGIWKSTDGGESWSELKSGLPKSIMGKIGVSVSQADNNVVYAIIESEEGGLYRSDDAGATWRLVNADRVLRARSWYYMHVFADPANVNTVHVLNAPYMRSDDGGKTFRQIRVPHGDNHALWINPDNPDIMINGNDGGANVSFNGGATWSEQSNQPTAQFYRVSVDNQFPYRVYGGQQDNSTVCIASATDNAGIAWGDFHAVGGCESAFCAFDPDDPRYVYATCIQGMLTEYDTELEQTKDIMAYSDLNLGKNPKDMKYRFNWNAPVLMSSHDTKVLYHAAQMLLKSEDRGLSWKAISPDLTRNIEEHIDWGGGPITNEAAGGENYHTIMYVAEDATDPNVIWVGADDGLVHVTRNGGTDWANITPPDAVEGIANCIELSPHTAGKAYLAFTRYKFNDFKPYVYITEDYGKTWRLRSNGIDDMAHVRVVREDPEVAGLLYAGTERGMFVSWDDGEQWERLQLNLPVAPVTDLVVHNNDLVVSTQGRSFWILDDIAPIRDYPEIQSGDFDALAPQNPYLWGGSRNDNLTDMGANPDLGLVTYFYAPDSLERPIEIRIANAGSDEPIRVLSTDAEEKSDKIKAKPGLNKFVWNLRRAKLSGIDGLMTFGGTNGTRVGPGEYSISLQYGEEEHTFEFEVMDDPRQDISPPAHEEKQELLDELYGTTQDIFDAVKNMRYVRGQIKEFQSRESIKKDTVLFEMGEQIISELDSLEKTLVQPKQETFQDVVNYPSQLDGQLMYIQSIIDSSYPPLTQGQKEKAGDLVGDWAEKKAYLQQFISTQIADYNRMIQERAVPFISTESPDVKSRRSKS